VSAKPQLVSTKCDGLNGKNTKMQAVPLLKAV